MPGDTGRHEKGVSPVRESPTRGMGQERPERSDVPTHRQRTNEGVDTPGKKGAGPFLRNQGDTERGTPDRLGVRGGERGNGRISGRIRNFVQKSRRFFCHRGERTGESETSAAGGGGMHMYFKTAGLARPRGWTIPTDK